MKKICTLICIAQLVLFYDGQAQTYNITTNTTWNATPPCTSNCVFNISAAVTLTINKAFTCSTCTFNGGNIAIDKNLTCQPCTFNGNTITMDKVELKPNSSTTSFSDVNFTITGTGDINANTPVNISNSTFSFYNTSYFNNNGGQLNITTSIFYFNDNSYFNANAGPVDLMSSSHFVAGDGTTSSAAYIKMNGPTLNIYDNSSIVIENKNNYFFDWGSYNYYTTTSAPTHKTYSMPSAPDAYGSVTLNSAGFAPGAILPVTLTDFSAYYTDHSVEVSWSTAAEINFDHFSIERSDNGVNWQAIGTVEAKPSSSDAKNYSFNDLSPLNNANYYRLEMIDKNGNTSYSKIIDVTVQAATSQVSIFPNPVINSTFHLKLASTGLSYVNIFSITGRLLYATSLKGQTQYELALPAAVPHNDYLVVQVISNGKTNTFSILNKS